MNIEIFKITWQEFFWHVQHEQHIGLRGMLNIDGRIKVLKAARDRFHSHPHFKNMTKKTRKELAGFVVGAGEIRWTQFGSTKGAGYFKHEINQNNPYISRALDQIPLEGNLNRKQYQGFIDTLQKAFVETGAIQCGFCTPAQLLTAKAYLEKNSNPTEAEIRKALSGVLCRCTGYVRIIDAVLRAAASMRGESVPPYIPQEIKFGKDISDIDLPSEYFRKDGDTSPLLPLISAKNAVNRSR